LWSIFQSPQRFTFDSRVKKVDEVQKEVPLPADQAAIVDEPKVDESKFVDEPKVKKRSRGERMVEPQSKLKEEIKKRGLWQ
jgi:esterase/lipase superfamily enzyme